MNLSDLAREQARRVDELFVATTLAVARTGCPFPVTVTIYSDWPRRVSTRIGDSEVASITEHDLRGVDYTERFDPHTLGGRLGRLTAEGYAARPAAPIPANITVGDD